MTIHVPIHLRFFEIWWNLPPQKSYHGILYLCGAESVPADVDDIIHPACDLVVATFMAVSTVPTEIVPWNT